MHHVDWDPPEIDRIRDRTSDETLAVIDRHTRTAIEAVQDSPALIRERLDQLDREWDVDRALMLNFSIVGALTAGLTMRNLLRHGRFGGFGMLFFAQMSFLAHHALRGWCPPLPVLRRIGFRTAREISAERVALEKRLGDLERSH